MTWFDWLLGAGIMVAGMVVVASIDYLTTMRRYSTNAKSRRNRKTLTKRPRKSDLPRSRGSE
jgi:hypothetical protein